MKDANRDQATDLTAATQLTHVRARLCEFVRETQLPSYRARELEEIIKDLTGIISAIKEDA